MASDFRLKDQLPEITDRIVRTYDDLGTVNHLDHCPLPSYEEIITATHELSEILLPGYRRRTGLHRGNISYYVGDLIDRLHDRLTSQISRALRHDAGATSDCHCDSDFEALGQAKTLQFLDQLPELRRVLANDVQAAFDGDPACKNVDEVIFCYPGFEAITVYRLAHILYELQIPFIPRMMTEWAHGRTGIDIHPGAYDWRILLHRSRHGCRSRSDVRDRRTRENLSRGDAWSPQLSHRWRWTTRSRAKASSDDRRSRGHLCKCHGPRRQNCSWPRRGDRLQRLDHFQRCTTHYRGVGKAQTESSERTSRRSAA